MDIIGERWTFLIVREAFDGVHRFTELQRNLGIARNILSARLQRLVSAGVLERRPYRVDPDRFEYHLTAMGRDLYPALVTIMRWGDEYLAGEAGPEIVLHHDCGQPADAVLVCSHCREELEPAGVTAEPGPGVASLAGPLSIRTRRLDERAGEPAGAVGR
jgi:DNA-binding HxlR family transcriptional regulator